MTEQLWIPRGSLFHVLVVDWFLFDSFFSVMERIKTQVPSKQVSVTSLRRNVDWSSPTCCSGSMSRSLDQSLERQRHCCFNVRISVSSKGLRTFRSSLLEDDHEEKDCGDEEASSSVAKQNKRWAQSICSALSIAHFVKSACIALIFGAFASLQKGFSE